MLWSFGWVQKVTCWLRTLRNTAGTEAEVQPSQLLAAGDESIFLRHVAWKSGQRGVAHLNQQGDISQRQHCAPQPGQSVINNQEVSKAPTIGDGAGLLMTDCPGCSVHTRSVCRQSFQGFGSGPDEHAASSHGVLSTVQGFTD